MARKCIVWWSSDHSQCRNLFNDPLLHPIFFAWPPPPQPPVKPHLLACLNPVSNATSPKPPHSFAYTDARKGPISFLCIEKRSHRIKRSKMFNYNIIYTISIKKFNNRWQNYWENFFSLQMESFWVLPNQWRQPNYQINVSEDKKKHVTCLTYKRGKHSSDNL